ncbi:hypothetical protein MO867_06000 [Microbulbifer sp. OS29]|uniref:Uncharacterized protein n=1 Tax=Microbulbifer okhotskensis TaxID=2926617 RepID=A0A9X2EKH9_9GAMM|nr:hypothetical protein [Microbulbifer okhotskensis]MCO1333889.1 hypothetical protein [Microbulbifer okhotskensis]
MNNIVKNLKDLLEGNYKYVKNTKLEEFKEYDDFKKRFVIVSSTKAILEAFHEVYKSIDERFLPGFFWLASSYNIHLYKLLPRVLSDKLSEEKKKRYLESCLNKFDIWPKSTFASYSDKERAEILNYANNHGVALTDQALKVLA